jgi:PKD repeat protein
MKYLLYISAPLFFCIALSGTSLHAQAPACDSLAYFNWNAQCNSVTFTPAYPVPGATYTWNFGDGSTSNETTPSHTYFTQNNAQYSAVLTVVLGNCIDKDTAAIAVSLVANELPVASMMSLGVGPVLQGDFLHCNASLQNPNLNLTVQNTSQNVPANTSYHIDWGDGAPMSMPIPFVTASHLYTDMGLYHIVLLAESPAGCVDSAQYAFFNGREPGVGIGIPASANLCCPPVEVNFESTPFLENNPPGTYYIYTVETGCEPLFSDTIPHANPLIPFTYLFNRGSCEPDCALPNSFGAFIVSVTAVNACGSIQTAVPIRISSALTTGFEAPDMASVGDTVCLSNTSSAYYWDTFNQECSSDVQLQWSISPSSGFTVESGSLSSPQGSETVCIRFQETGLYSVSLNASRTDPLTCCAADSNFFMRTISVSTVSASEQLTDGPIRIVPNPTAGTCSLLTDPSMEVLSVDVYNMLGQRLAAHSFSQRPYFLENTSLEPGQYLLRIHLNGNRYTVKKLIVF